MARKQTPAAQCARDQYRDGPQIFFNEQRRVRCFQEIEIGEQRQKQANDEGAIKIRTLAPEKILEIDLTLVRGSRSDQCADHIHRNCEQELNRD